MSLREKLTADMKEAMKAGEKRRLSTIRLINAAIKDRDILNRTEGPDPGITDTGIIELLAKMVKQRQESAATYEQGGRPELAAAEIEEIGIIAGYMPRQLSEDEAQAAIKALVAEIGASGMKDMGRTMAALKEKYSGQMDFTKASAWVKSALG
ncbi:MAG: GatB/YqeY domain-containing protein [Aestuariivirgaceae bacterium]|nr:GatB/YqeY domain-containing protein [Aestuariivirgaceae bacterium]